MKSFASLPHPEWLSGLADGEGSFTLYTRRRRNERYPGRIYRCINFAFKIAMRKDDMQTLILAQVMLGDIGRISRQGENRVCHGRKGAYRGNPLWGFVVNDRFQLLKVVEFFRRYPLRSKKKKDFEVWADALELYMLRTAQTPLVPQWGKHVRRDRQRWRGIPEEIITAMEAAETRIKDGRRYVA